MRHLNTKFNNNSLAGMLTLAVAFIAIVLDVDVSWDKYGIGFAIMYFIFKNIIDKYVTPDQVKGKYFLANKYK